MVLNRASGIPNYKRTNKRMINVNEHHIEQAILTASQKLRLSKDKGQYFLEKMLIKDSQSSRWRVSFILPLTMEERRMDDVRPKIEAFSIVPNKSKAVEITINSDNFISFNQVDRAIELAVDYIAEFQGIVSAEFMYVENSSELYIENNSELYIDKWDFVFNCVNEEKQKLYVDIRINVETKEVTLLEVTNKGEIS